MEIQYIKKFEDIPHSPYMGELMLFTTKAEDFAKFISVLTDRDLSYGVNIRQYCVEDVFDLDDIYVDSEWEDHHFEVLAKKIGVHFEANIKKFMHEHPCGVILIAERDERNACWDFQTLTPSGDVYVMIDDFKIL